VVGGVGVAAAEDGVEDVDAAAVSAITAGWCPFPWLLLRVEKTRLAGCWSEQKADS
jgi:hypothetical protein